MVFVVFIVSALIAFGIAVVLLRPTADQKALDRRLASLKSNEDGTVAAATLDLELYLKTLKRGQFGWLEDMVSGTQFSRHIQRLIIQSDSATAVGTVLAQSCGFMLAFGGTVWAFTSNAIIALPLALLSAYLPLAILGFKCRRRVTAFNKALPDCIDMIARSLRAGHSLVAAIAIVAEQAVEPARTEFGEVYKKQNYGLPFREALMQLLERVPSQDLRVLVTGILVQKDTGGNLAEILDRILFVIKERIRIQGEIRTHTAQGRMTGWILCALPIVMLVLINIVNPGYSNVLFTDPVGKKMLYAGVGMLILGAVIIRQIINGIEV
jgi:tight adherence protein B